MESKKEKKIILFLLILSVAIFFFFGFFHLSKFETTDEQLWKYGRIKNYWQAISEKKWEKTYINDKPGITVALISGMGLIFEPKPETHIIKNPQITQNGIFEVFDSMRTERINYAFRLPILIFSTLSLLLFFWLARKIFDSGWLALFSTLFIAFNPIIIGMAQIINPDSFLWIFGGLSVFSWLAYLNKAEKKFFWLTAIFTGLALLSKYTASILFFFYFLAVFSKIIFGEEKSVEPRWVIRKMLELILVFIFSILIFSLFLPAVFIDSKYLVKGISQFLNGKNIFWAGLAGLFFLAILIFWKKFWYKIVNLIQKNKRWLLVVVGVMVSLVFILLLLNVWTGQKIVPLDEMKDTAYAQEPKNFNFGKILKQDGFWEKKGKLFLMEAYPFVFSLTPLFWVLIGFVIWKILFKKIKPLSEEITFSLFLFFIFYFFATVFAKIIANVRYSILLYPMFALLGAVVIGEMMQFFKKIETKKVLSIAIGVVFFSGLWTLWFSRPFYFSYANPLLPKKFTIHDSWGHGFYEAAKYINSFLNSENLIVRSNSNTICPFLKGKCLKSRRVNLNLVQPDFFVVSKRGVLKVRNQFILENVKNEKDSQYYHQKLKNDYDWAIFINERPENYIKVLKYEK